MADDARDPQNGTQNDPQSDTQSDPRNDPLSRYLEAAMGLTDLTRKRAEKAVRGLLKQGEAADNPRELVENLLERSQENRETLVALVRGETRRAMKAMGLATTNDVERLEQQLRALRRELAETEARASEETGGATATEPTTEKTAEKKAAKKKSTKKKSS